MAAGDEEKAGLLRRLVPAAAERLRLFEADLFDAATFAPAIAGCRFVFLVATPYGLEAASSKVKFTHSLLLYKSRPFFFLILRVDALPIKKLGLINEGIERLKVEK